MQRLSSSTPNLSVAARRHGALKKVKSPQKYAPATVSDTEKAEACRRVDDSVVWDWIEVWLLHLHLLLQSPLSMPRGPAYRSCNASLAPVVAHQQAQHFVSLHARVGGCRRLAGMRHVRYSLEWPFCGACGVRVCPHEPLTNPRGLCGYGDDRGAWL